MLHTQDGNDDVFANGTVSLLASTLPLIVFGGAGDDEIYGGLSDDVIVGDNGFAQFDDVLIPGTTIHVSRLRVIETMAPHWGGNDSIYAGNGFDLVLGGSGDDLIDAGLGDRVMS